MRAIVAWPRRGCAALVALAAALAGAAAGAQGNVVAASEARQWLLRLHSAATQRNYQGTLVVSASGSMSSSRITHYCEGSQSYERVDVLDGKPRRVLRKNDQMLTLWPAAKVARLEQREAIPPFPALLASSDEQLFDRYELVAEGPGRLAGHDASVFLLRPRDGSRFAQRLWSEQATGLLLRADVLAADGRVLESSAFSELTLGARNKPESVNAALKQLDGWRVLKPVHQRTALEAEGWQLKIPVAGFRQTSCVKRHWEPAVDEERQNAGEVVQAVFTDGLTHVSLFIEPSRSDRQRPAAAATGATHTWMQPVGTHWVTVVGDVPMATLKQFAAALERKRP